MAFEDAGGGAGGGMDLMALLNDPQRSDALAAQMATHFSPSQELINMGTDAPAAGQTAQPSAQAGAAAMGQPPAGPPPASGDQMSLGDVPKYTPPPAGGTPSGAKAGQSNYQKTAALAGAGQSMMKPAQQQAPSVQAGGAPRPGGQFAALPPGIPAAQPTASQPMGGPMMPAQQNPMLPPGQRVQGLPPSLADLARGYGQ